MWVTLDRVILEGDGAGELIAFLDNVFTGDWNQALDWPCPTYSDEFMAAIRNTYATR